MTIKKNKKFLTSEKSFNSSREIVTHDAYQKFLCLERSMDYQGQKLSEYLYYFLIIIFGV